MSEKEVYGEFSFDQDSKRYHRFRIETDQGIVGLIYVPRDGNGIPKKIILKYENKKTK